MISNDVYMYMLYLITLHMCTKNIYVCQHDLEHVMLPSCDCFTIVRSARDMRAQTTLGTKVPAV